MQEMQVQSLPGEGNPLQCSCQNPWTEESGGLQSMRSRRVVHGLVTDQKQQGHPRLNGHEFEQALGDGEGQGSLACCNSRGHEESDMTEQLTTTGVLSQSHSPATQGREGLTLHMSIWSMSLCIHRAALCPTAEPPDRRSPRPALGFPGRSSSLTKRVVGSVQAPREVCGHRLWAFLTASGAGGWDSHLPVTQQSLYSTPGRVPRLGLPPPTTRPVFLGPFQLLTSKQGARPGVRVCSVCQVCGVIYVHACVCTWCVCGVSDCVHMVCGACVVCL